MIEFGKTLRSAREAKGYTVIQLGDITRMAPSTINDLEEENFSRIAAPIYGRGFVKLYCSAVGIDAQPLIEEFMAIYEGNRDLGIRERKVPGATPPAAPTAATAPAAAPKTPAPVKDPLFDLPAAKPAAEPELPLASDPLPATDNRLSRYATPLRLPSGPHLSPACIRIGILSIASLFVLILLGFGIRALYQATGPKAATVEKPLLPAVAKPSPVNRTSTPRAPRTPIRIKDLYVD